MTPRTVKLSSDDEAKESELFTYYNVQGETYSEQYRDFLSKSYKAMRLTVVIDNPSNPAVHPAPNLTVMRCSLRKTITINHKDPKTGAFRWAEKVNVCVNNPPHFTVIPDPALCEVCLEKFYGQAKRIKAANPDSIPTAKTKEETKQEQPAPQLIDIPAATRQLFRAHYDQGKHCPFDGKRIIQGTCYNCNNQNPKLWAECRALVKDLLTPQQQTVKTSW
ncbi:MAG: hypothetical protein ACM3UN_03375 [Bacillota bacterium]